MKNLTEDSIGRKIDTLYKLKQANAPGVVLVGSIVDLWVESWKAFPEAMGEKMSDLMESMVKMRSGICHFQGCKNPVAQSYPERMRMEVCQTHYDEIETFDK